MPSPRHAFTALASVLVLSSPSLAAVDFAKDIFPVFQEKCVKCHATPHEKDGRTIQPKGGLDMQTLEGLTLGGDSGDAILAGKPEESLIFERVTLPHDSDEFMPPSGKADPLTEDELKILKQWILEGANFGDWKAGEMASQKPGENSEKSDPVARLAEGLTPLSQDLIQQVSEKSGARLMPLALNHPLLSADFMSNRDGTNDGKIEALLPLKEHLTRLDVARTPITDHALSHVAQMTKLHRIDLHQTGVTDAGLKHLSGLKNLIYLNLYGTQVTDAGLAALESMTQLQSLYLWQSKVTEAGVKALQEKLPNLKIVWQ